MAIDKAKRDEWRAMVDACDGEEPASDVPMTDADLAFFHAAREAVPALLDEAERLQDELDRRPKEQHLVGRDDRHIATHRDGRVYDVDAMLSLLREIEWSSTVYAGKDEYLDACPSCDGIRPEDWSEEIAGLYVVRRDRLHPGHAPDCRLKALIG